MMLQILAPVGQMICRNSHQVEPMELIVGRYYVQRCSNIFTITFFSKIHVYRFENEETPNSTSSDHCLACFNLPNKQRQSNKGLCNT